MPPRVGERGRIPSRRGFTAGLASLVLSAAAPAHALTPTCRGPGTDYLIAGQDSVVRLGEIALRSVADLSRQPMGRSYRYVYHVPLDDRNADLKTSYGSGHLLSIDHRPHAISENVVYRSASATGLTRCHALTANHVLDHLRGAAGAAFDPDALYVGSRHEASGTATVSRMQVVAEGWRLPESRQAFITDYDFAVLELSSSDAGNDELPSPVARPAISRLRQHPSSPPPLVWGYSRMSNTTCVDDMTRVASVIDVGAAMSPILRRQSTPSLYFRKQPSSPLLNGNSGGPVITRGDGGVIELSGMLVTTESYLQVADIIAALRREGTRSRGVCQLLNRIDHASGHDVPDCAGLIRPEIQDIGCTGDAPLQVDEDRVRDDQGLRGNVLDPKAAMHLP